MKVRKLKKILKNTSKVKVITLKSPDSKWPGFRMWVTYCSDFKELKCTKSGVIIIDKIYNQIYSDFLYTMVTHIE